ncbi:MAG: HmuY family protein [Flavobacteriaceae bacterium]|nr:HmuY family protein [Flavobacteriaceae bacterium]
MKTIKLLTVLSLFIALASCTKNDTNTVATLEEGTFSRTFEMQGMLQRASYTIDQDKISYTLSGDFASTDYVLTKKYYAEKEQRWIGVRESNGAYYVLFFKEYSDSQITIYKKQVTSLKEGKEITIPAADDTENYGWNLYKKDLAIQGKYKNLQATQTTDYTATPHAITGDYIKFSFEKGSITEGDDWDIAFRGTTILVNGGSSNGDDQPTRTGKGAAYIAKGTMNAIKKADTGMFQQDDSQDGLAITTGSGNGWYDYNPQNHQISPIAGKIIVIKTATGNYAKLEILSYYKDGDSSEKSQYYTFNYVFQPILGEVSF